MLLRLLLFSFLFVACSVKQASPNNINKKVNKLEALIMSLSDDIAKKEAFSLARNSINHSYYLAKKYQAITSPWIQNTLINIGIKERGLCHEWTEDLLKYLMKKEYKTLEFYAVGANIGYMNEHNALSVSAKGKGVNNSIVLDAWRNSGDLYFRKIKNDKKYEWRERFNLYGILPPRGGKE